MQKILVFFGLLLSCNVYSQFEEEKQHTFFATVSGGVGFTTYHFNSNSPSAPYNAPEINQAFVLTLPFKASLMYHHALMNAGYGLDERRINVGLAVKRQSLSGKYYDYDSSAYVDLRTSFYKLTGRAELILIEHERNQRTGGFGLFVEAGSFFVRSPIGRTTKNGFTISGGGFYFQQIAGNLFLYMEISQGYDHFKTIINQDYSSHNLLSSELQVGLRIKL